jgi:hypothetical protein
MLSDEPHTMQHMLLFTHRWRSYWCIYIVHNAHLHDPLPFVWQSLPKTSYLCQDKCKERETYSSKIWQNRKKTKEMSLACANLPPVIHWTYQLGEGSWDMVHKRLEQLRLVIFCHKIYHQLQLSCVAIPASSNFEEQHHKKLQNLSPPRNTMITIIHNIIWQLWSEFVFKDTFHFPSTFIFSS